MFTRVVSLGWFCSPALEIKRIGLRDASYPFDWLLTHDFSVVVRMIDDRKAIHLYDKDMMQYAGDPSKWYNKRYAISIFHDFSKYIKMCDQLDSVNAKYAKRAKRFYEAIKEPTLFIRYIKDQTELAYILKQEESILQVLQRYNSENEIVFVANTNLKSEEATHRLKIYYVEIDENDYVARSFWTRHPNLETI